MGLLRETSSRDRRTVLLLTLLGVFFVLFHLIVFPRPLRPEFTLVPVTATVLSETKADRLSAGGSAFVLAGWEGYWSAAGTIERVQTARPQMTVSGDKFAWYDAAKAQVTVEGPAGVLFALAGEQYPWWSHGRLFTFDENRMVLKAWDAKGTLQWTRAFSSLITALDTSPALTVVGTLDGKVQVVGPKGESAGGFQPGGSRLPVVYNVAIDGHDAAILVLAGVDPKRFLVLSRGGAEFRPVFHKPLKESRPWPTPLGFVGNQAYYETDTGLAFLDPEHPDQETLVPTEGTPLLVEKLSVAPLVAFVQSSGDRASLRIASPAGPNVLTLPFAAHDLMLRLQGDSLFLGVDQTLLRLEVKLQ